MLAAGDATRPAALVALATIICMTRSGPLAAAFLVCSVTLSAQQLFVGDPLPLSSTRYERGQASDQARLVADGKDFYLFWLNGATIRMTRVVDEAGIQPGIPLVTGAGDFDVVWTGTHFLVAYVSYDIRGPHGDPAILSMPFDRNGGRLATPAIAAREAATPQLAWNGRVALLIYQFHYIERVFSVALTAQGLPIRPPEVVRSVSLNQSVASAGGGFAALTQDTFAVDSHATFFDETGHIISQVILGSSRSSSFSIAGNANSYLVTTCNVPVELEGPQPIFHYFIECQAQTLEPSGKLGGLRLLESAAVEPTTSRGVVPASVWAGDSWIVGWSAKKKGASASLSVLRLDSSADLRGREESEGSGTPVLAAVGSRVKAAWRAEPSLYGISVQDLPLGGGRPVLATFTATEQRLLATASSNEATLVVWTEDVLGLQLLRAGIRTRTGQWRETDITSRADDWWTWSASAASDGRDFVIALATSNETATSTAYGLDSDGAIVWSAPLPFFPEAMAWNGTVFGLIGGARLATMTPLGHIRTRGTIPHENGSMECGIASNGDGFLAIVHSFCYYPGCVADDTFAVRLSGDLQPADERLIPASEWYVLPKVVWDGGEYVATWIAGGGTPTVLKAVRIPVVGPIGTEETVAGAEYGSAPIRFGGGLAIAWIPNNWNPDSRRLQVGIFPRDRWEGQVTTTSVKGSATLAPLADGGLAIVSLTRLDDVPFYQAKRLTMNIARWSSERKPEAPVIDIASAEPGLWRIAWKQPASPVLAHRLEYRTPMTPWKEYQRAASADDTSILFEAPPTKKTFQFRVRAWNDAGASGYSNIVSPVRRRAVR